MALAFGVEMAFFGTLGTPCGLSWSGLARPSSVPHTLRSQSGGALDSRHKAEDDNVRALSRSARQMRSDLGAGVDQALHGVDRLLEHRPLRRIEVDLDDLLDAIGTNHYGHAHIHALHAVFAVEVGGAGEHAALVLEVALGHLDGGGRGRVEGGAGLQQVDDLAAAAARTLDD